MKLGVLSAQHQAYADLLAKAGVEPVTGSDPDDLGEDVEVLLADPDLARAAISRMPRLRWVQSTWAGVDALAADPLPEDLVVTRMTGIFGPQMREFVLAYLLAHERRVLERLDSQRAHRWDPPDHGSLVSKTLGIMGTGDIGREIAFTAQCVGMTVRGLNRRGQHVDPFDEVVGIDRRLNFAEDLHHLVVVLPATHETRHLVDSEMINQMRRGGVLINVGRGSVVRTDDVVEALRAGRLGAAVLDVLEEEPLPPGSELWDVPNLHITAHTAAVSYPDEVVGVFLANLDRWRSGEPLTGAVDWERGY